MKAIIISILIFFTAILPDGKASAQNIRYVNRDATGQNNGTSWTNAWKRFENINWASLNPGDTVYVSGGSDSTVYTDGFYGIILGSLSNGEQVANYSSGNPVVITSAWHSGHSGDVYIKNPNASGRTVLGVGNISNLKIVGLSVYDDRTTPTGIAVALGNGDWGDMDSLLTFENCTITGTGHSGMIGLGGTKTLVKGCTIGHLSNSNADDQDIISMQGGRGGHTIDGNLFYYRNTNVGTDAHRDMMQISNMGLGEELGGVYATERLPVHIKNNLFLNEYAAGSTWNAMLYSSGAYCNVSFYVYNNIIVNEKNNTNLSSIWIGNPGVPPFDNYVSSLYVLNNTVIMKGNGTGGILQSYNHDTLIVKNNLFIMDSTVSTVYNLDGPTGFLNCHKEIDYNYYAFEGGTPPATYFASEAGWGWTYDGWKTEYGHDPNSVTGNSASVTFTQKYSEAIEDYYTTTGRDEGVDLSNQFPFLKYDILGNERIGNWDLGALEFGGTPLNGINVKGKVFLQGPFNTNSMSTNLTQSSLLPNSQPYNQPPWNYNGNESFSSGPNSAMVDWVLVELRSASNPAQVVARRAAVLKNNGLLLSTNGIEGVYFNNVDPGSYYLAVYHRNHLAIMSTAPVQLSSNSTVYDFTTAMNKAYGQNPMVELSPGKYGMYATDGNADGIVNSADRDDVWLLQNGNMGYLEGDFNMNSGVTIHDVNQLWNPNNGAETQVP